MLKRFIKKIKSVTAYRTLFICVILFWGIILFSVWIIDLRFPLALFEYLSWDEYQYLPILNNYQSVLIKQGVVEFIYTNEPFGYGAIFWQIYALGSIWLHNFFNGSDSSLIIFNLRCITFIFQVASLTLVMKILKLIYVKNV
ncbi:MAG: hypothetical protein WCW27_01610 [Patescibacteria group bacterium]|jgi:hypothetical protein